jgi:hypothetical protein
VDQASADVQREAKKPEDDENYKDGPKHDAFSLRRHGICLCHAKSSAIQALKDKLPGKIARLY